VRFQGATTNFEQEITSMQYEHENIESAKKGQEIGVKTNEKVREGDDVYLLE
jgi:translation initiation factor IF-2